MKKYIFLFVLLFSVSALAAPDVLAAPDALAARGDDDDLIILDDEASTPTTTGTATSKTLDFLQKSFFFSGGGFWSGAGDKDGLTQGFGFARLGFDYSFKVLGLNQKVYVTGGYSYRSIELGLTFEEGFDSSSGIRLGNDDDNPCQFPRDNIAQPTPDSPKRECKFTIKVEDEGFELREAYGSFELYPDVVLSIGRQRPTWGQFEVFSAVNSLLPIEVQSKEFGVSNTNLRRPQDLAQLNLFLFERLELAGYVFYGTTLDPLLEKALLGGEFYSEYTFRDSSPPPCGTPEEITDFAGNDLYQYDCSARGDGKKLINQDKINFAGRLLWRGSYLTAGFTFNQGYFSLFNIFNRLPVVEDFGDTLGFLVEPRLILPRARSYGLELAVPINNWTIKTEVVYTQSQSDIGVDSVLGREVNVPSDATCNSANTDFLSEARTACRRDLFKWIVDSNGGRGYVDVDTILAQVGFSADYDNWDFGLNVLLFTSLLSDEADRANELYKKAYPGNDSLLDSNDFDGIPLPTAYVFYNFGADKQHRIGFVAGFLGIAAGANVFYTGPLYLGLDALDERINWTLSADYTTSLASQLIGSTEDNERSGGAGDSQVELTSDFAFSVRAGATLEF